MGPCLRQAWQRSKAAHPHGSRFNHLNKAPGREPIRIHGVVLAWFRIFLRTLIRCGLSTKQPMRVIY